ncbi:LacI family DNA-binding transcriptional regulator [Homoserinibacter sp. YIM 151385]|uniref:LacI family DNA-binding transcriptional regulator n=1 Tax=Homoserinibacter sp. YIM 151385 TaxID=2985506 RepID=UPI0022F01B95|nr:LacI family DNA-binding transcriptional regulator [Homoserinibacter sp. YIM 151385]WBU37484.1 LacI family DNA-binding transcriptional regulator [Homoserinibacter sp. YIM 151385]
MADRTTLGDVAAAAGVSMKTVSRVMNDFPSISERTRKKVLDAIAELDYVPDSMARSLRGARDRAVAVIIDSLDDPFFAEAAQAVEAEMAAHGYLVMVASSHRDPEVEARVVEQMRRRRVAGLIFSPAGRDAPWAQDSAVPVVAIDRDVPEEVMETVKVDDRFGARIAIEHFAARGHRRIAYIGDPTLIQPARDRIDGYHDALRAAGVEPDDERLLRATLTPLDAARATRELLALDDPPTAIFSASRLTTLGVIAALHSADRTDVAMIGFGDFAMSDALVPAITVIDHRAEAIGRRAAASLLALFGDVPAPGPALVPLELIERGSGELPPGRRLSSAS